MRRRRVNAAPPFKTPAPFNPMTGGYAPIGFPTDLTRTAMLQVLEEKDDYLLCRGYDPESRVFLNEVAVAKPYLLRRTPWDGRTVEYPSGDVTYSFDEADSDGVYRERTPGGRVTPEYFVGDILVCAKPITRIGTTPGTPDGPDAGTAELNRIIDILNDENGNPIWWMDLNAAGRTWSGGLEAYRIISSQMYYDEDADEYYYYGVPLEDGDNAALFQDDSLLSAPTVSGTGQISNEPGERLYVFLTTDSDYPSAYGASRKMPRQGLYLFWDRVGTADIGGRKCIVTPSYEWDSWASMSYDAAPLRPFCVGGSYFYWSSASLPANQWNRPGMYVGVSSHGGIYSDYWPYTINGRNQISTSGTRRGRSRFGLTAPVAVQRNTNYTLSSYLNRCWGPADATGDLHPGLPGFVAMGQNTSTSSGFTVSATEKADLFMQATRGQILCGKCYGDWQHSSSWEMPKVQVTLAVQLGNDATLYDGSHADRPLVRVYVTLPVPFYVSGGSIIREIDPEVYEDDWILFEVGHLPWLYTAIGSVGASKIGDLKWINYSTTIPKGWQDVSASMQGKFIATYKSGDADFGYVGATGGSVSHTHSTGAVQSGAGATAVTGPTANHLPPYYTLRMIERTK